MSWKPSLAVAIANGILSITAAQINGTVVRLVRVTDRDGSKCGPSTPSEKLAQMVAFGGDDPVSWLTDALTFAARYMDNTWRARAAAHLAVSDAGRALKWLSLEAAGERRAVDVKHDVACGLPDRKKHRVVGPPDLRDLQSAHDQQNQYDMRRPVSTATAPSVRCRKQPQTLTAGVSLLPTSTS